MKATERSKSFEQRRAEQLKKEEEKKKFKFRLKLAVVSFLAGVMLAMAITTAQANEGQRQDVKLEEEVKPDFASYKLGCAEGVVNFYEHMTKTKIAPHQEVYFLAACETIYEGIHGDKHKKKQGGSTKQRNHVI